MSKLTAETIHLGDFFAFIKASQGYLVLIITGALGHTLQACGNYKTCVTHIWVMQIYHCVTH